MIRTRGILLAGTLGLLILGSSGGNSARSRSSAASPAMSSLNLAVEAQDQGAHIPRGSNEPFWPQWGANPQHTGMVDVEGQHVRQQLADIVYDKFVPQESAENLPYFGEAALTVHYQAPILDGNDVYMMTKTGTYISCNPPGDWLNGTQCGPNTWNTMIWNETRFTWGHEHSTDKLDESSDSRMPRLVQVWSFQSDWKPEPDSINDVGISNSEPVFHPAEANSFIYVPGAAGTVWKVEKTHGTAASHINPFEGVNIDPKNTFVSSALTADAKGNIYYNVVELVDPALGDPWAVPNDVLGSWLVKVTPEDNTSIVTYAALLPDAPAGTARTCPAHFFRNYDPATTLPWPPTLDAVAPTKLCGSQRPAINAAPAVAPDGTVYVASTAHFDQEEAFLVAVNPNLKPKWGASLQNRLSDGCGVLVPFNDPSNSNVNLCRNGATLGVDPTSNAKGTGRIVDAASSSPTVLPDGSVVFGAITLYNGGRGHLFHFDAHGHYLNAFDFGWDVTPSVYSHDDTYSLVIKDNHYPVPLYCQGNPNCQSVPANYLISQINPNMQIEWSFQSTNTENCHRNPDGSVSCISDHPNGFEWCTNMPAIDERGHVYVNSEDGNLYNIPQGHRGVFAEPLGRLFLNVAIGAAYTPLSIGPDGKIYTQNNGHMFVVGNRHGRPSERE